MNATQKQLAIAQQAVPEGFALVPVDPTDAMRIAGGIAHESSPAHDVIGPLVDAWAAMLAAAPAAPQAEPKGTATEGWRLVGASSPEEYAQFQTWLSYGKPHATPSPAVGAELTDAQITAAWKAWPELSITSAAKAIHFVRWLEASKPPVGAPANLERDYARALDAINGHVERIKVLEQQVRDLQAFKDGVELHQRGGSNSWYWLDDRENYLETMVASLPVVIRAEQLRELLTTQQPAVTHAPLPKGWHFNHARQEADDDGPVAGVWQIGWLEADDAYFAPIITVDTSLYYREQDAEPLTRAILARLRESDVPVADGKEQP